jgi:hypothetical protein
VIEGNQPFPLRVTGQRSGPGAAGERAVALAMLIASQKNAGRAHYRADVTLDVPSAPPRLEASDFAGMDPFPISVAEAYKQWLFQGPCFAGITAIEGIRRDAIAGTLRSVAPALCLPDSSASDWLLDPTVVDASLQLVILWERHWHDMTPLPMRIGRFRLFESLSGHPVRCLVKAVASDGGESLKADIYYADMQGRLLAVLEGLQCACTKALNRLSERAEPRSAGHNREMRLEATR